MADLEHDSNTLAIWSYSHPVLKRSWRLDPDGLHEIRDGRPYASIHWAELEQLSVLCARSETGVCILPRLSDRERRLFAAHAYREWHARFPERYQRDEDRRARGARWAIYAWMPLMLLLPCAAMLWLIWLRTETEGGHPADVVEFVYRCALTLLLILGSFMLVFRYLLRDQARRGMEQRFDLETFSPPTDYAPEPELLRALPRELPATPALRRGFPIVLPQACLLFLAGIFALIFQSDLDAAFSRSSFVVRYLVASIAPIALLAASGWAAWLHFRPRLLYRRGLPFPGRVVRLRLCPAREYKGRLVSFQYEATIDYLDPLNGHPCFHTFPSLPVPVDEVDRATTTFKVGDWVTLLQLPSGSLFGVDLYAFRGTRSDLGVVVRPARVLPLAGDTQYFGFVYLMMFCAMIGWIAAATLVPGLIDGTLRIGWEVAASTVLGAWLGCQPVKWLRRLLQQHQERLRSVNEERSRLGEAVVEYPIPWLPGLLTMHDSTTMGIISGLPLFFALLAGAAVASLS